MIELCSSYRQKSLNQFILICPAYAAVFGLSRYAEAGEFTHALPISMDQNNPTSSR